MPSLNRARLLAGSILSTLLSVVPWGHQGAVAKQAPPSESNDLRPGGQTSEAAVRAIMEKWNIAKERADEEKGRGDEIAQAQFISFRPEFIQVSRPRNVTAPSVNVKPPSPPPPPHVK